MGRTRARVLGKRRVPARRFAPTGWWVPARAVFALFCSYQLSAPDVLVALTCGCGGVTEINVHRRGRTCAALTRRQCEAHKWAYFSRPAGCCGDTRGICVNAVRRNSWLANDSRATAKSVKEETVEYIVIQNRFHPLTLLSKHDFIQ